MRARAPTPASAVNSVATASVPPNSRAPRTMAAAIEDVLFGFPLTGAGRLMSVFVALFAVLLLIEMTDVIFAVDSVPAVLAVSHEQFIVFASNAFAIMGLRALYFLLADMHARFSYLQQGLAVILAFVGIKMLIHTWYHIPTWLSLLVIALVLLASIGFSVRQSDEADTISIPEDLPPPDER